MTRTIKFYQNSDLKFCWYTLVIFLTLCQLIMIRIKISGHIWRQLISSIINKQTNALFMVSNRCIGFMGFDLFVFWQFIPTFYNISAILVGSRPLIYQQWINSSHFPAPKLPKNRPPRITKSTLVSSQSRQRKVSFQLTHQFSRKNNLSRYVKTF